MSDLVERVARAIAACDHPVTCDADWQCCVVEAQAAIAACVAARAEQAPDVGPPRKIAIGP